MELVRETGSHFDFDEESARRLMNDVLTRLLFAHLATASEHGPRESPVWFLWEDGAIWLIGNNKTDSFPGRIAAEPRCALGIVDFDISTGLVHHVGFRGRARLGPHDSDRMKRVFSRYMGEPRRWDSRFVKILNDVPACRAAIIDFTTIALAIISGAMCDSSSWPDRYSVHSKLRLLDFLC